MKKRIFNLLLLIFVLTGCAKQSQATLLPEARVGVVDEAQEKMRRTALCLNAIMNQDQKVVEELLGEGVDINCTVGGVYLRLLRTRFREFAATRGIKNSFASSSNSW